MFTQRAASPSLPLSVRSLFFLEGVLVCCFVNCCCHVYLSLSLSLLQLSLSLVTHDDDDVRTCNKRWTSSAPSTRLLPASCAVVTKRPRTEAKRITSSKRHRFIKIYFVFFFSFFFHFSPLSFFFCGKQCVTSTVRKAVDDHEKQLFLIL